MVDTDLMQLINESSKLLFAAIIFPCMLFASLIVDVSTCVYRLFVEIVVLTFVNSLFKLQLLFNSD